MYETIVALHTNVKSKISGFLTAISEPYKSILRYFFPEWIVALLLYAMLGLIDAHCIAHLKSTSCYASLGIANTLTFFINKIAEGISVGAVIMCGRYQGQHNYDMVGRALVAALWATALIGGAIAAFFYFDAHLVCAWLHIPEGVSADCIPFLRIRAIGILFMFLFSALIGFLRGVKNTRAVMYCFVLGAATFIFFDYALIFGMFGFKNRGFLGSAMAFTLQYMIMFFAALLYIIWRADYRIYNVRIFNGSYSLMRSIVNYSWPVTIDKAALQIERLWMLRLIAPMGSVALGTLNVIKDMEMVAYTPAIAFAQVVTLMASNEYGAGKFEGIKKITKIIMGMAAAMVATFALLFAFNAHAIISIFDRQHTFTEFAATIFPVTAVLLLCDLAQLILAGALRGTGNVRVVMWVRIMSAFVVFIPFSWWMAHLPWQSQVIKFVLVYGAFNLVNGLSSIAYIYWFKSGRWLGNKS